jgi:glycosyltransferase involved in cell wall biosynthesis
MQGDPIVHVVRHLQPGDLNAVALELARCQSIFEDTWIISLEGCLGLSVAMWPRLAGFRDRLIFMDKKPGLDSGLPRRLYGLFRDIRPSVVHTHHTGPLIYAGPAARMAGVPVRIHTEHDTWHKRAWHRRLLARLAIATARPVLVADAPPVASTMARALGCPPPAVILNGIDTMRFRPGNQDRARLALGLPLDAWVIGIMGPLEPTLEVDVAIHALAAMTPSAVLAIAGTGPEETALKHLAVMLGLAHRIVFLGQIDDVVAFYRSLDALCVPGRTGAVPLPALEAQSCGVPVVASSDSGLREAICPWTGQFVRAGDVEGFAVALSETADAPSDIARAFVVRGASLAHASAAYLALYSDRNKDPADPADGSDLQPANA